MNFYPYRLSKIIILTSFIFWLATPFSFSLGQEDKKKDPCEKIYLENLRENKYGLRSIACKVGFLDPDPNTKPPETIQQIIIKVTRLALGFVSLLAVAMIIYAGITWMTAAGNEERARKAQKILLMSAIGLVVATSAWLILGLIVSTVQDILKPSV